MRLLAVAAEQSAHRRLPLISRRHQRRSSLRLRSTRQRIETTLRVVSILLGYLFQRQETWLALRDKLACHQRDGGAASLANTHCCTRATAFGIIELAGRKAWHNNGPTPPSNCCQGLA